MILRFLLAPVGQLVAAYLLYLRPMQSMLLHSQGKALSASINDYLWVDDDKKRWDTDRLTRVLAQQSTQMLGTRLTMQAYRHIAVGIGRKVVGERFAVGYPQLQEGQYKKRPGGYIGEGGNSDEEDGEDPLELQNARSTRIGTVAYAVRADIVDGLSMRSIDVFGTLSQVWHAFLGFAPPTKQSQKRQREQMVEEQVDVGCGSTMWT